MKTPILRDPSSPASESGSTLPANQQAIVTQAKQVVDALTPLIGVAGPYGALVVAGANAVLAFGPPLLAEVESLFRSGQISDADQQAVLAAYNTLHNKLPTLFQGPEWQQIPVAGS